MKTLAIASALLITPVLAEAQCLIPSNYSDCILRAMKGITSDVAARAIEHSCRKKFPEQARHGTEVPRSVLSRLNGNSRFYEGDGYSSTFSGQFYNGNADWVITQITVDLAFVDPNKEANSPPQIVALNLGYALQPLDHVPFCLSLDVGNLKFDSWAIRAARGNKLR